MDDAITAFLIVAIATAALSLAAVVAVGLGLLVLLFYTPLWLHQWSVKRKAQNSNLKV